MPLPVLSRSGTPFERAHLALGLVLCRSCSPFMLRSPFLSPSRRPRLPRRCFFSCIFVRFPITLFSSFHFLHALTLTYILDLERTLPFSATTSSALSRVVFLLLSPRASIPSNSRCGSPPYGALFSYPQPPYPRTKINLHLAYFSLRPTRISLSHSPSSSPFDFDFSLQPSLVPLSLLTTIFSLFVTKSPLPSRFITVGKLNKPLVRSTSYTGSARLVRVRSLFSLTDLHLLAVVSSSSPPLLYSRCHLFLRKESSRTLMICLLLEEVSSGGRREGRGKEGERAELTCFGRPLRLRV